MALSFQKLNQILIRAYGMPHREQEDPLETLIATVLSQNTTDTNSARAFDALQAAFPTWEAVAEARAGLIEKAIRPGGLAKTKAVRIQKMLRAIRKHGTISLDYLRPMAPEDAEKALLAFDGVGLKTARCVLLFGLGHNAFPIDTHIERILKRLGLAPQSLTVEKMHAIIPPMLPKDSAISLHLNLIRHGRKICHARNPECPQCCLRHDCPSFVTRFAKQCF